MRLPVFLAALFMIILVCSGCPDKGEQKPYAPPLKIAVSMADMERDGNKIVKKVMDGRKKEDKADITWLDAGNSQSKQEEQLDKLGDKKVKAVVFQPVNPVTGPDLMRKLVEKNIRVVALDTMPVDVPVDAYVASDHKLAGQLLARFAIMSARKSAGLSVPPDSTDYQGGGQGQSKPPEAQLGGKLPIGVVLLSGDPKDMAAREIAAAARAAVQGSAEVRLVAEEAVPQGDPARVPGLLQKLQAEKGNTVQAILATDSGLAMAAVEALKAAGLNDRILTAGVGADEKASRALEKGDHDAEVDTRPDLLGQYAMDAAMGLARDGRWEYDGQVANGSYSVPSRITPVRLITSENVYLLKQRWEGEKGKKEEKGGGGKEGGSEGGSSGESEKESGGGEDQQGSQQGSSQGGEQGKQGQGKKTMLRITTQDGKTMEVQIDGEVKKIESMGGGQGQGQGQQQGGQ